MSRILIIEDSRYEADQVRALLEGGNLEVAVADTGAEGMKLAHRLVPDLILLDLILPDMDGREVCRWLRTNKGTQIVPVIMVTARGKVADKVVGLKEGANDYIAKPFEPEELLARVDALLRTKRVQDRLIQDNQDSKKLLKILEKMAITDPVTGLHNRNFFRQALEHEYARSQRFGTMFSCLLMDVDHFKEINDTYGHEAGDQVLRELGKVIEEKKRTVDRLARYGGDELALLLPETPREKAEGAARRILDAVRKHSFRLDQKEPVTLSIGISGLPDTELSGVRSVVLVADFALYQAKSLGRNRFAAATAKMMNPDTRFRPAVWTPEPNQPGCSPASAETEEPLKRRRAEG